MLPLHNLAIPPSAACFTLAGVVMKCPDPRHAMVEFADKEQVLVPTRLVIATSGAVARPQLMV